MLLGITSKGNDADKAGPEMQWGAREIESVCVCVCVCVCRAGSPGQLPYGTFVLP